MRVREAVDADIPSISRLYFETVRRVNARDYSPGQIEAWAPEVYSQEYWRERFRTRRPWVVAEAGLVADFAVDRSPEDARRVSRVWPVVRPATLHA